MSPHVGEDQGEDEQSIKQLVDWAEKQPHLPKVPGWLLSRMLHCCYGSVERTKTAIDNFFTIFTHAPELFKDLSVLDERYENAMKVMYVLNLEKVNKDGHIGILFKFQDTDPSKFEFTNVVRAGLVAFFSILEEHDRTPGCHAVFDFTGVTMGHIMRVSLTGLKQLLTFVQEALPVRLLGIHFINSVPIVQNIVSLVKPLMKKELIEIFHVHVVDDMPKFYAKYVEQVQMPMEYGGANRKTHDMHDSVLKGVKAHINALRELDGLVVDETKRQGATRNASEVFGIQGSFKKLDLD